MANLEAGTPWTLGTLSESGSVAKQFTATAIVLLARDGVLSLDDDISRWIPEVRGLGRKITIRHLLTHTSGLPDRYTLHEVQGRAAGETDHTMAEVLDVVAHLRELNFDPGEDYLYSNTGYIVAATIVERASGKSLEAFTDARIFQPLGMTSTRWREDHRAVVPGRAAAYSGTMARGFRNDHPFTRVIGSGGLLTTVDDFLKWQDALLAGGEPWGAVRDSLEHTGRLNDGTELTYGFGVNVDRWRGVRRVSHTGSTGGYRAALARFPEQQTTVALLCNLGSIEPGGVAQRVATIVLGNALAPVEPEPQAIAMDSAALGELAGAYHAPRTEEVMVLWVRNGQLVDSTENNAALIPLARDKLKYRGSRRTLTSVPGTPARLRLEAPNARTVEYLAMPRPKPDAATLAGYAGDYQSPELDVTYHLVVRSDTLRIARGWQPPIALRPLYKDGFVAGEQGLIRFLRDGRARVTGFVLWAGRVRHLRFERVGKP
jgi:CubicO group peptidase (beta-lactamase class C family)